MSDPEKLQIAVVGGGVAGIVSAYLLSRQHRVTLFEANDYLGGHTHTVTAAVHGFPCERVDTGFIVFNDKTYPGFIRFLQHLEVPFRPSEMSFGYYDSTTGHNYAGTGWSGLFARRRDWLNPRHWRFLYGVLVFSKGLCRKVELGERLEGTLGDYLKSQRTPQNVIEEYVIPMTAAIWSASDCEVLQYPIHQFAHFFYNHGLLSFANRPTWYTVCGGSSSYVEAFSKKFAGEICLGRKVTGIKRRNEDVLVELDLAEERFDRVVIATHADQALELLADPSPQEQALLQPWFYSRNQIFLHSDTSLLAPSRKGWAAWNYVRVAQQSDDTPVAVTYHMNRLQGFAAPPDYLVSLNPANPPDDKKVLFDTVYHHPVYTPDSIATQADLPSLNGVRNTYYCGSYFRHGFHEDAVQSALQVAGCFGIEL